MNSPATETHDEQPEQPKTIPVEWTEVARYRAELTPDKYRELFGLGGTPDELMPRRIAMIGAHDSTQLAKLVDDSDYLGSERYQIITIHGRQPGAV